MEIQKVQRSRRATSNYSIDYASMINGSGDLSDDSFEEQEYPQLKRKTPQKTKRQKDITTSQKKTISKKHGDTKEAKDRKPLVIASPNKKIFKKPTRNAKKVNTENIEQEDEATSIPVASTSKSLEEEDTSSPEVSEQMKMLHTLRLEPVFGKKPRTWNNADEILKLIKHVTANAAAPNQICAK